LVEELRQDGDQKAILIYEAMAYQVSKEIGALATVIKGKVDAIALTGGIAHSVPFTKLIKDRVSFIAPVYIIGGEHEMRALALGALRVIRKKEEVKVY